MTENNPERPGEQPRSPWAPPTVEPQRQGEQRPEGEGHRQGALQNEQGRQVLFGSAFPSPPPPSSPPPSSPPPQPGRMPASYAQPYTPPRWPRALLVAIVAISALIGGTVGALTTLVANSEPAGTPVTNALDQPKPTKETAAPPAGSVEAVAETVLPTVVQVQTRSSSGVGEGSGFIISSDGLILTNNHVVASAAAGGSITVVFQDDSTAEASIVGRDPTSDVAVIRVEGASGLPVAELGRSDDLQVGQPVVAIGSPFQLSGTVTSGIVSALHRPTTADGEGDLTTVLDAIQTDAAINPGNSGGPLVNMQGQVIGINSAIYSPSSGSVGIGFAIPIDQARRTADQIVATGQATQTVLGVTVRNYTEGGALIVEVTPGGPAEKAGLQRGQVITKLNDRQIDTSEALVAAVRSHAPRDRVQLTLGEGERTVEVTLGGDPVEVE